MSTPTRTGTTGGRWRGLLLAALTVLLALLLPAASASAEPASAAGTRVGVFLPAAPDVVGVAEHIAAGQHLARAPSQPQMVVGNCVAAEATGGSARLGETVSPLGRTYENSGTYLNDVAGHYGINLRGVKPVWDYDLASGVKGLTKSTEGGWTVRINPGFADEPDLANTIAHELSHARDFQKGLTSPEGPAYNSGDALEEWIYGLR